MESLFERVENLRARDSSIRTFQTIRMTDEELSLAMTDAMFNPNGDILYSFISRTRSGRRVFKQLCLQGKVPFLVHLDLKARQESDLAFNVIVGRNMWNFVLELYHHSDVTQRSRRQAFWRAVRQQVWDCVTKMAASDVTWERDRRTAFLAAVRREQFGQAVQLCIQGVAVTDDDLRFAIKTCFATGHWDVACEFLQCCQSDETRNNKILKCILKQAVQSGIEVQVINDPTECLRKYVIRQVINSDKVECFRALCGQYTDNKKLVRYAFKKALKKLKGDTRFFIIPFSGQCCCGLCSFSQRLLLKLTVQLAVKAENWDSVRDLADIHDCIDWIDCLIDKTSILETPKNWQYITPILELLIERCDEFSDLFDTQWGVRNPIHLGKVKCFTKWCEENAFSHLSIYLSVKTTDWSFVKDKIDGMESTMGQGLLGFVFDKSWAKNVLDVAVACLKRLSPNDLDKERFYWKDAVPLIDKCRSERMKDWVVTLAMWTREWQILETEMESCDDETLRNFVLRELADLRQWQIVSKLLTKCSGSESCLGSVLRSAVQVGECQCAKTLMNMINPISENAKFTPIMHLAAKSCKISQEMVSVCIAAGVSTHHPIDDLLLSPVEITLNSPFIDDDELFSVIKALFESGACSHKDLLCLKNNSHIQGSLKRRSQLNVLQYMDEAANRPHSLQNLCRLTVSHRIGCQPGREDRVLSLPVPLLLKYYIMFSDLTSKN